MEATFGPLLRAWRTARGKSQLALSIEAGVSSRHLSFVETGRSNPSREMVLALAQALDVPLRDRNALLEAAGFAPVFRETPLDAPAMADVRDALEHILRSHEPNVALVLDRRYDVLMANDATARLFGAFAPEWRGPANVARMVFDPSGLRPAIDNWPEIAGHVAHRLRAELTGRVRDATDEALLAEAIRIEGELASSARAVPTRPLSAVILPIRLRRGALSANLFTAITTLGTPLDITLQELRIETLFPADAAAKEFLLSLPRA